MEPYIKLPKRNVETDMDVQVGNILQHIEVISQQINCIGIAGILLLKSIP